MGAAALAAVLPSCEELTDLSVADCRFGDAGALALAAALPMSPVLTSLAVGGNDIGEAAKAALCAPRAAGSQLEIDFGRGRRR